MMYIGEIIAFLQEEGISSMEKKELNIKDSGCGIFVIFAVLDLRVGGCRT